MKKFTLSILILIIGMAAGVHAQILRVPANYPTIQEAVDAAAFGDTVLVAPGTYQENIMILGNAKTLTLASNFIFSGDTNDINNTIIDASQPQNPNYGMGVLIKNQDTTIQPKITGFTITGGTGYYKTYGGGIYANNAVPVIEYNRILGCSITGTQPNGGGIYVGAGNPSTICIISHNVIKNCLVISSLNGVEANGGGMSLNSVRAVVEDNKISGNVITGNSTVNANGAGIFYYSVIPLSYQPFISIINNEITNNSIESWHARGGGICLLDDNGYTQDVIEKNKISANVVIAIGDFGYATGGGIFMYNPAEGSDISTNIISNNNAIGPANSDRSGGGIYLYRNPSLWPVANAVIEKNRITGNAAYEGAGLFCQSIGLNLVNNFISGNQADLSAGAICFFGTANAIPVAELINNTITFNSATSPGGEAGGIFFSGYNSFLLMNNIFYGNQAETSDEMRINSSAVQINNCDINTDEITGTWTGENNFFADPEFIDEMKWDCWSQDAPCSNSGIQQVFAFDQWFGAPPDDISNNPRPEDGIIDVGVVEVSMCFVGYPEVSSQQSTVSSYPNPFSSSTTFEYSLEESGMVTLEIFSQVGQSEVLLVNEQQTAGQHKVQWNADGMPAGIYYYSLRSGKQVQSGEIIIMK